MQRRPAASLMLAYPHYRAAVLCLVGLTAAACARVVWTKPDFSAEDFRADSYACERDMRQSGYFGTGILGAANAQAFYERCLLAKGYYKARLDEPRTAPRSWVPTETEPVACPGTTTWNGVGCTAGAVPAVSAAAPRPFTPDTFSNDDLHLASDTQTHAQIMSRCMVKVPLSSAALWGAPSKWPEPFKQCYRDDLSRRQ